MTLLTSKLSYHFVSMNTMTCYTLIFVDAWISWLQRHWFALLIWRRGWLFDLLRTFSSSLELIFLPWSSMESSRRWLFIDFLFKLQALPFGYVLFFDTPYTFFPSFYPSQISWSSSIIYLHPPHLLEEYSAQTFESIFLFLAHLVEHYQTYFGFNGMNTSFYNQFNWKLVC